MHVYYTRKVDVRAIDFYRRFAMKISENYGLNRKCIKGSTHYQGDKQDFDVSSEGPSPLY